MYNLKTLSWILLISILFSCKQKNSTPHLVDLGDESNYLELADTIISDVVILNPDGDEWTDYTLRKLDKKTLVDEIFKSVYSGELEPFEFFNNTPLTIDDIKDLEKAPEFSRDKIAKVQFEEAWYYDAQNKKMIKKVHSIMLAYEIYSSLGELKGYKPAFKVYFNNQE